MVFILFNTLLANNITAFTKNDIRNFLAATTPIY